MIYLSSVCSDPNAEYSNYAPSCKLTCETVGSDCTARTAYVPGCYCKPGMVKNCLDICVPTNEYCKPCASNEYYSACALLPEASCQNVNQTQSIISGSCICKLGFIRDYFGKCVPPSTCPSKIFFFKL